MAGAENYGWGASVPGPGGYAPQLSGYNVPRGASGGLRGYNVPSSTLFPPPATTATDRMGRQILGGKATTPFSFPSRNAASHSFSYKRARTVPTWRESSSCFSSKKSGPDPGLLIPRTAPSVPAGFFARCVFFVAVIGLGLYANSKHPRAFQAGLLQGALGGVGLALASRVVEAVAQRRRDTAVINLLGNHFAGKQNAFLTRCGYLILMGAAAYAVKIRPTYGPVVVGGLSGLLAGELLTFQVTKRT